MNFYHILVILTSFFVFSHVVLWVTSGNSKKIPEECHAEILFHVICGKLGPQIFTAIPNNDQKLKENCLLFIIYCKLKNHLLYCNKKAKMINFWTRDLYKKTFELETLYKNHNNHSTKSLSGRMEKEIDMLVLGKKVKK